MLEMIVQESRFSFRNERVLVHFHPHNLSLSLSLPFRPSIFQVTNQIYGLIAWQGGNGTHASRTLVM
jgi:hypothetical protein